MLEDVGKILSNKEVSAKKFVEDRMRKRKLEDGGMFFNLTDDPYNPVFNMSIPKDVSPTNAPFSSIASSKFEIEKSFYTPNLEGYINGSTGEISVYNKDGDSVDTSKLKKLEVYNPFQEKREVHTRELPLKFRRRIGRCGIEYIDRKGPVNRTNYLDEFVDFSSIDDQEQEHKTINVYDSKLDNLVRLVDKWKYDSESNEYGTKFSNEPARLNQISNSTQVIRFGTMLGTKSYEQLRDATLKYRQEIYNRRRNQKLATSSDTHRQHQANGSSTTTSKNGVSTPASTSSSSSSKKSTTPRQQLNAVK